MCGIAGIISITQNLSPESLVQACQIVRHRGPDDEGYLLWEGQEKPVVFAGPETSTQSIAFHSLQRIERNLSFKVGLGHRRLSILDLSPKGHQPMVHAESGVSVVFNGEVYNYLEIRNELKKLGHTFFSDSDTEVIVKAWAEWGPSCLNKFNGMFALLILDPRNNKFYAVRDRFGVKPLYWTKTKNYFGFASEIKQLKVLPEYSVDINKKILSEYLAFGQQDHSHETFTHSIFQLKGGQILTVDLTNYSFEISYWYELPLKKWSGSEKKALETFEELLTDSIRLRLRADVPVGSCLSGGLDSSAIVCLMEKIFRGVSNKGIKTITACFEDKKYDEWEFAEAVITQTKATPTRVYPSFVNLKESLDQLLWHMDEPFGSTSIYSQWCVFKGAADAGLKVMLDGQGSDEQLAGYGGNDMALYTGLMKNLRLVHLLKEASSFKNSQGHYPSSQLIGAARRTWKNIDYILPGIWKKESYSPLPYWINPTTYLATRNEFAAGSLRENLKNQLLYSSLPALLHYEDRNSMAWSIESRVPFLDYRFVEFTLSLPEHLVYTKGIRKYILREALKNTLPAKIYERKDKMGFVTPEERWIKGEGKEWFTTQIAKLAELGEDVIDMKSVNKAVDEFHKGNVPFDFSFWRLACVGIWMEAQQKFSRSN